jgi:hypothetical protein
MLDQDSVLAPQLAGKAVNAEGSIRHLAQDDLEGYANGRLGGARLDNCRRHLDACEACRAELEDIRTLQTELSSFTRPEATRGGAGGRRRRRSLAVPLTASGVAVLVVAVGAVAWWRHGSPRAHGNSAVAPVVRSAVPSASPIERKVDVPATLVARSAAPAAAPVAQSPASPATPFAHSPTPPATPVERHSAPTATPVARSAVPPGGPVARSPAAPAAPATAAIPTHDSHLTEEIAALPDNLRSAVAEAIQHGRIQLPPDVRPIHEGAPASSAQPGTNTGFSLLGPFGEATSDTRPKFTWQPVPGAIGYTVAIVDPSLRPVQHSPGLRATAWHPHRPLARGRTYLWQVTATMHGGAKVVASSPAPSEAFLRVIPRKLADQMEHFQRGHRDAHLVLGVLYAQAGMLTEGANELRKVLPDDSSYDVARRLLPSVSSERQDAGH